MKPNFAKTMRRYINPKLFVRFSLVYHRTQMLILFFKTDLRLVDIEMRPSLRECMQRRAALLKCLPAAAAGSDPPLCRRLSLSLSNVFAGPCTCVGLLPFLFLPVLHLSASRTLCDRFDTFACA